MPDNSIYEQIVKTINSKSNGRNLVLWGGVERRQSDDTIYCGTQ